MNDYIDPVSYVMFVEINLKTSGNTWTTSTKTNKSYPGSLPDVLGQNKWRIWIQGIKTHLNLDAHFFIFNKSPFSKPSYWLCVTSHVRNHIECNALTDVWNIFQEIQFPM